MNMMTMRTVSDGQGGTRHIPVRQTAQAPARRTRTKRRVPDPIKTNGDSAAEQLRQLIERIEGIDAEIAELQADRADVVAEAKSRGYDVKGLRAILVLRRQEKHIRDEDEAILDTYKHALGLL